MSEILEEFWIFSKEGNAIVNFHKESNGTGLFKYREVSFDQNILDKIKNFIVSNLQDFSMNQDNIIKLEEDFLINYGQRLLNGLVIFYKTNPDIKEKKVLGLCKMISEILEDAYPLEKIQLWDGSLSFFDKLKKKIVIYFKMSSL